MNSPVQNWPNADDPTPLSGAAFNALPAAIRSRWPTLDFHILWMVQPNHNVVGLDEVCDAVTVHQMPAHPDPWGFDAWRGCDEVWDEALSPFDVARLGRAA